MTITDKFYLQFKFKIIAILLISFLVCMLDLSHANAQTVFTAGQRELIVNNTTRDAKDLDFWPDCGVNAIYTAPGEYDFYGCNSPNTAITHGTLTDPANTVKNSHLDILNPIQPTSYFGAGKPYKDPITGNILLFYLSEDEIPNTGGQFTEYIGVAVSKDNGVTFTDTGRILSAELTPNDPDRTESIGLTAGPPLVVKDGYIYTFYTDWMEDGTPVWLTAARANLSDLLTNADNMQTTNWYKYYNGGFTQPGLGGKASSIQTGNPTGYIEDVVYSQDLNEYIAIFNGTNSNIFVNHTADFTSWTNSRQQLTDTPYPDVNRAYMSVLDDTQDPKIVEGNSFWVYYTEGERFGGPVGLERVQVSFADVVAGTIVVDSTADTTVDADGECTLREAIINANAQGAELSGGDCAPSATGTNTINFNIAGGCPQTISPLSALPDITSSVIINGYSQTGAQENSAPSPQPFNGTICITLSGANAGPVDGFTIKSSNNSTIKGLAINDFQHAGIRLDTSNTNKISGNYIGTNSEGNTAIANQQSGILITNTSANNSVGGTLAADRNILSGNTNNNTNAHAITTDAQTNIAGNGNVVQGNYIGLGADGLTIIANDNGVGMYDVNNMTVGGTSDGARNVISGNIASGINAGISQEAAISNNLIAGNYIGTDYTGTVAKSNGNGINTAFGTGTGNVIGGTTVSARNIVSGNKISGIAIDDASTVQGNYIGLGSDGSALGNGIQNPSTISALSVSGTKGAHIGGTTSAARNIISAQGSGAGIGVSGITPFGGSQSANAVIQGNCIGTNANCEVQSGYGNTGNAGILVFADVDNILIGGSASGAGNIIAGNKAGIVNLGFQNYSPLNISILGNSIYANSGGNITSIGIDNLQTDDFVTFVNQNVTLNDADDIDYNGDNSGTNHYLNFPVIQSITSTNGTATITYNLDINDAEAGATGYRVEFFANNSADPSGYGQGQTYLGSDTVSGDVTGRQVTITLPNGVDGSKYITATTTMTDNSSDGFGHSSEFAANVQATLVPYQASSSLALTGTNMYIIVVIASGLIIGGSYSAKKVIAVKLKNTPNKLFK